MNRNQLQEIVASAIERAVRADVSEVEIIGVLECCKLSAHAAFCRIKDLQDENPSDN